MLAKIDLGKPSLPQLTDEPIIAQALPDVVNLVCYTCSLLKNYWLLG